MGSSLQRIPDEVLVEVLLLVGLPAVLSCRLTCRDLKHIIDNSAAIQFSIDLATMGYELSSSEGLPPISQCRDQFKTHWTAMNNMDWTESRGNIRHRDCNRFSRGIYAAANVGGRSIMFTQFPSIVDNSTRKWEHVDVGIEILDFCFDPDLDLLVIAQEPSMDYVGFDIHIRSLADLSAYPRSNVAVIPIPDFTALESDISSVNLQIAGNLLGIWFGGGTVAVWDYVKGTFIGAVSSDKDSIESFTFLDTRTLLVTRITQETSPIVYSIDTYHINTSLYTLTRTASLRLPFLMDNFTDAFLRLAPFVIPSSNSTNDPSPFRFAHDDDDSVIALDWHIRHSAQSYMYKLYRIYIHIDAFPLRPTPDDSDKDPPQVITLDWGAWGPRHARLFKGSTFSRITWGVYGRQAVASLSLGNGTECIALLEFSKHIGTARRREDYDSTNITTSAPMQPSDPFWTVADRRLCESFLFPRTLVSVVAGDGIFAAGDVTTSLPYRVVTKLFQTNNHDISKMIYDGKRIVCELSRELEPNVHGFIALVMPC